MTENPHEFLDLRRANLGIGPLKDLKFLSSASYLQRPEVALGPAPVSVSTNKHDTISPSEAL